MSDRELRAQLIDLTGPECEWPNCRNADVQLAHIEPKGMGGRASVNHLRNVWLLCREHHDLFDGRSHQGLARAMRDLATGFVATRRSMIPPN